MAALLQRGHAVVAVVRPGVAARAGLPAGCAVSGVAPRPGSVFEGPRGSAEVGSPGGVAPGASRRRRT
jgi:hypothetical protein